MVKYDYNDDNKHVINESVGLINFLQNFSKLIFSFNLHKSLLFNSKIIDCELVNLLKTDLKIFQFVFNF